MLMNEDQLQLRAAERVRTLSQQAGLIPGTGVGSSPGASVPAVGAKPTSQVRNRGGRKLFAVAVLALTVGMASVWTFIALQQLQSSIAADARGDLDIARKSFETLRERAQANLQAHCRVLVEDPRLKSTLATEGIDAATVADILNDLGKLRGEGFLMVLSPEGRVFAEAGAPELNGLDLSDSSIVKKAQAGSEATVGSWVLAGKVMDLSIMAIRYGDSIVAYLAVGQPVDDKLLGAVAGQTGVAVASALAQKVVIASSADSDMKVVLDKVAADGRAGGVITVAGVSYVAGVADLAETAQAHRLVMARPLDRPKQTFSRLHWLLFVPPFLVLIAVLFAMSVIRSPRRA
jgi:hypothetical protein